MEARAIQIRLPYLSDQKQRLTSGRPPHKRSIQLTLIYYYIILLDIALSGGGIVFDTLINRFSSEQKRALLESVRKITTTSTKPQLIFTYIVPNFSSYSYTYFKQNNFYCNVNFFDTYICFQEIIFCYVFLNPSQLALNTAILIFIRLLTNFCPEYTTFTGMVCVKNRKESDANR